MGKIKWIRVFIGGLAAGMVINALGFVAWAVFVRRSWSAALQAIGQPLPESFGSTVVLAMVGFLIGYLIIWLYAAIRPRYGAGPKTAIIAGIAAWLFLGIIPDVSLGLTLRLIPARLWVMDSVETLVIMVTATLIGAWTYKEPEA